MTRENLTGSFLSVGGNIFTMHTMTVVTIRKTILNILTNLNLFDLLAVKIKYEVK